jgi:hypothetical protein
MIVCVQMLFLGMEILYTGIPIFIAMTVFGVYAWQGHHLTAEVAFPALAYLNMLHGPLMGMPRVIIATVTARISLKRLQDFVDAHETEGSSHSGRFSVQSFLTMRLFCTAVVQCAALGCIVVNTVPWKDKINAFL